mmetsp:Transcript_64086/g.202741  ORF Transcript_64086/g.202741 Transcript_64086/m.202741 type:complete len:204 (+) Transcript_64086:1148-1759(+)
MPRATPPCAWPCRRASSTSAVTRRPPTFARPRPSLPTWRRSTPCTTAPRGSPALPTASTASPAWWPRAPPSSAWARRRPPSLTPCSSSAMPPRCRRRRWRRAPTCVWWTRSTSRSPWTRPPPSRTSTPSSPSSTVARPRPSLRPPWPEKWRRSPATSSARARSFSTRSSTRTTRSTRCCATLKGWRTRTCPWCTPWSPSAPAP